MNEQSLSFSFEARYLTLGEVNNTTNSVWFVLHGYGQLARYFIKKFAPLAENNVCVVAPEGLSRFYLEDVESRARTGNNRVGATWMTRENREMDIRNYLTYLDAVYENVIGDTKIPVTLLGFSQGAATVSRWAISTKNNFDQFVLWAGIFPPDMNFEQGHQVLSEKKVHVVFGKKDPYINDARMTEQSTLVSKLDIQPVIHEFDGGHEIDPDTLLKLI